MILVFFYDFWVVNDCRVHSINTITKNIFCKEKIAKRMLIKRYLILRISSFLTNIKITRNIFWKAKNWKKNAIPHLYANNFSAARKKFHYFAIIQLFKCRGAKLYGLKSYSSCQSVNLKKMYRESETKQCARIK